MEGHSKINFFNFIMQLRKLLMIKKNDSENSDFTPKIAPTRQSIKGPTCKERNILKIRLGLQEAKISAERFLFCFLNHK